MAVPDFLHLKSGDERYGVTVIVDMETGVQYLYSERTGMCPRVDQWGKPMALTQDQLSDLRRKGMRQTTQYI